MIKDRYTIERQLWDANLFRVMGLDEVGRGCLCGPVVAAGVILNPEDCIEGLADSKTISRKQREMLAEEIEMRAVYTVVKECSPAEIDELNILKASISAMVKCAEAYGGDPDYLLIDGNRFTSSIIPYQCIVKGDDRSASIAAASILAKVHRDKIMHELHNEFPYYGWNTNVGYPTKKHYKGLKTFGYTTYHRKSFKLKTSKKFSLI